MIIETDEAFGEHIDQCLDRAIVFHPLIHEFLEKVFVDEYEVTIAMVLSAVMAEVILQSDASMREFIVERSIAVLFDAIDESNELEIAA